MRKDRKNVRDQRQKAIEITQACPPSYSRGPTSSRQAGLLAQGSLSAPTFPNPQANLKNLPVSQWSNACVPFTAARPRRIFTAFPFHRRFLFKNAGTVSMAQD
jgi:hypothetical protein